MAGFDEVARTRRVRRSAHLPGQVLAEVAVMIADGGEAIADLAVLRNQPGLFGLVASPATCWRVLDAVDAHMLAALKQARAAARERAWLLRGEAGRELPTVVCGGRAQPGLVIDIDATLVGARRVQQLGTTDGGETMGGSSCGGQLSRVGLRPR